LHRVCALSLWAVAAGMLWALRAWVEADGWRLRPTLHGRGGRVSAAVCRL